MADNAPNSVVRPPYPNVVAPFNKRLLCHIINFTGADGSVTYNASRSTGGTGISRTGEGLYTITFPAGGTGAIGWVTYSAVESATATIAIPRILTVDNDVVATNYVAGSTGLVSSDSAGTNAVNDVIGDLTVMVWVLAA